MRSLRDLNCEAIGFSHGSGKKEEEERKSCTILTPFAYFYLFIFNLTGGLISKGKPKVLYLRYCIKVLPYFLAYIFRTHLGTKIEIENIVLKILDVVYTDYRVYIDERERIMIVIITTIY